MKKVTKTKNKRRKTVSKKIARAKRIESHYLAIIIIAFVLLEGFLITSTHLTDWQNGFEVLDMSTSMTQTGSDFAAVVQPISDAISGVNEFYEVAANEMMVVLDISNTNPMEEVNLITGGIYEFYQEASVQMASLLDVSDITAWPAQVAGVSITVY